MHHGYANEFIWRQDSQEDCFSSSRACPTSISWSQSASKQATFYAKLQRSHNTIRSPVKVVFFWPVQSTYAPSLLLLLCLSLKEI
ncbi:hypothetical protein XELAEV_18023093mg [Xenopus laevis]|uniref:Uncharacterized protein n=1 Tax=Xenopus laevis TaxID=8355 RepID=A0A974HNS8_XENLA|nr:hypothetical protein XELAEV_18023093mg [Xenopus laevis]